MLWWLGRRSDLGRCGDELTSAGDLLGAGEAAIGEQAIVPDAVETLGQHMHEEPANELAGLERHGLVSIGTVDPVIFVFEGHTRRIGGDQAAVGNSDTVGVAGQVGQDLVGTGERTLVSWVKAYRQRRGRSHKIPEVQQAFGLARTTARRRIEQSR
jgi:hypothetical protein